MADGNRGAVVGVARRTDDDGAHRGHEGFEPWPRPRVYGVGQTAALGQAQAEERPMTVFVYVNTSKQSGIRTTSRCSRTRTRRKHGSRKKAWRLSTRCWSEPVAKWML